MKLREGEPWMDAAAYGRSLKGVGVNLLVSDIAAACVFAREVLAAKVVYEDPDFAALEGYGSAWQLHADHSYKGHPLYGSLVDCVARGVGCEIRMHGRDPDAAEEKARALGCTILAAAADKPHGLREAFILDDDGYLWVPDIPLKG
ncbi:MAG: VOC family protein [Rhodospirillales bacterium]